MRLTRPRLTRSLVRGCATLALATLLAGCGASRYLLYPPQSRGNQVDPDRLAELVPGTATQGDATSLLGSPTMKASFDENTWLYISEITRPRIAATQHVIDQQVVALTFDTKGVLRGITTKTAEDSHDVGMAGGATPAPGYDPTFLQQLLGNIGRFNPGLGSSNSGPGTTSGNY